MCGIAGIAGAEWSPSLAEALLRDMGDRVRHRGPDGEGVLWHARDRVGLAHRRLAVVDTTPAGAQPMESASGRYAIVFNGEIFNASSIARDLAGNGWQARGRSDTEVMLAAFERWGLSEAIERFAGMFAFALHDRRDRVLHLVRDRLGIKPMHWSWVTSAGSRMLAFASELRSLTAIPGFDRSIDPAAVGSVLARGCVTGQGCIWRSARKLAPGHRLELDLDTGRERIVSWWSAIEVAVAGCSDPIRGSDAEVTEQAVALLDEVMAEHLVSDVPLGCMLSGGLDSATVALACRSAATNGPSAWVAGFDDPAFDERSTARQTAETIGMPLHEFVVGDAAMLGAVPRIAETHDEPFADSSQIPTWLICREMRRAVTVALSGDGGDETFAGYHRHVHAATGWRAGRTVPAPIRTLVGRGVACLSPDAWDGLARGLAPLVPRRLRTRSPGMSLHKWAGAFRAATERSAYESLTASTAGRDPVASPWWRDQEADRLPDFLRRMQFADQTGYLVDDVLVKVDRASMAHGLEVRVPLLDHRIVAFAWRLPAHMKVRNGCGKWLLRQILSQHLPDTVLHAPKRGFAVPLGRWLQGPLREWAGDLLSTAGARQDPLLDTARLGRAWESLQAGSSFEADGLWSALMYLAWRRRWAVSP